MKFENERRGIGVGAVIAAVIVVILLAAAAYFIFAPSPSTTTTTSTSTTTTTTTSSVATVNTTSSTATSNATGTTSSTSAGCGTSSNNGTIAIPQGAGSGLNFCPSSATIVIGVNNTITWVDQDTVAPHNVYFTSVPSGASQPATSPTLTKGDTFSVTLTTPGSYSYECQFHPGWMQGKLNVVQGTQTGTTSTTSNSNTTSSTTTMSSSTSSTSSSSTTTSSSASGATAAITIPQGAGSGQNFSPASITVAPGTTITWTDQDSIAPHNVYFTSVPTGATNPNPAAGPPTLLKGDTYSVTLTTPGTYTYECQFHASWMQATIIVSG